MSKTNQPKNTPPPVNADDDILGKAYDPKITRRLLTYMRPYWRNLAVAMVCMTIAMLGYVVGPYLINLALAEGITKGDLPTLGRILLAYAAASGVFWVGTYLRIRIMARTGQDIIYDLRRQMFAHLQALSLGFYSRYAVGRLVSRMVNDVSVLREMIVWAVLAVARDFIDIIGTTVAMFLMNWQWSLLSFTVLPLMAIATEIFRRRARESYRKVRSAIGWVNAVLNENIVGVRVVQSFSREDHNYRVFAEDVNGNNLRVNNTAALIASIFFPTVDFIGALALYLHFINPFLLVLRASNRYNGCFSCQ